MSEMVQLPDWWEWTYWLALCHLQPACAVALNNMYAQQMPATAKGQR